MRKRRIGKPVVAKPGRLTLGVLAGGKDRALDRGLQGDGAGEMGGEFADTEGAHRRQRGIKPKRQQPANLVQGPRRDHGRETLGDGAAQSSPLRVEADSREFPIRPRIASLRPPGGDALAGAAPNLPGARHALAVSGANHQRTGRIMFSQLRMQPGGAVLAKQSARFIAGRGARGRNIREAIHQRCEIHPRPAAQDRQQPPPPRLLHCGQSLRPPPADAAGRRRGKNSVKPMGRGGFGGGIGPGGNNAQLAINLHRVGVDHHPAARERQIERQRRFAASGGPSHDQGAPRTLRAQRGHAIARPMYVLTLIAARTHTSLDNATINAVADAVGSRAITELSAGEAAALACPTEPPMAQVRAALGTRAIDAIATPADHQRKQLLVADMDSTIVTTETLDELAAFAGLKDQIAAITRRAMNGELDFKEALRHRVSLLKGLNLSALEQTWRATTLTQGARELVATMNHHGATTALVSGGFSFFTARVAALCGFTLHRSNELQDDGLTLTGTVTEPILDKASKYETLIALAASQVIGLESTLAIGDGANDLPMIQAAGLGIAFHAKPIVAASARAQIVHGDLRAALFAQGYEAREFYAE